MSHRYGVLALMVVSLLWSSLAGATARYSTARITLEKHTDLKTIQSLGLDITAVGEDYADAVLAPGDEDRLQATGLPYTITVADLAAFYQSRLDPARMMGGYRTFSEIELVLDSIYNAHPEIVTPKWSIGSSIEGRPIWVIKISDSPNTDEDEPEAYYYACHHAREVITPEVLIYFMRYLTDNYGVDPEVTYLVDNRELFFSPCLNPDGYVYNEVYWPDGGGLWRKNRRDNGDESFGVDINRNYGYAWGYDDDGSSPLTWSETYRGSAPFSEPEIQAQRDFINSRHFRIIANYHSAAGIFLYPWGYDEIYTPDEEVFAALGDTVYGMTEYPPGPPWLLLYPVNGGSFDWEYGEQTTKEKIYAFCIEVGSSSDGFWPPTTRITPLVQLHLQPNLFYARVAANPEGLRRPSVPTVYPIGDVDTSYFELSWHHFDEYNPAESYEVWQLQNVARITDSLERGVPAWIEDGFWLASANYHSSSHSYFSGNQSNLDSRLSTIQVLRVASGDTLRFWTKYGIATGWDYGYVEVSSDGVSWSSIPGNITTTDNPNGQNLGNGITGNSGTWVLAKFPLAAYVGQDIAYRFRYISDASGNSGGWYVDDIYPTEYCSTSVELAVAATDTSLLVTDLTNGKHFYRVRAKDGDGQYSDFSPFVVAYVAYNSGCSWEVADANGDGKINISDAVYLISYIFSSGPAPTPNLIGSGDADCSGGVNISDAVYLIAYIFSGGPIPAASCSCFDY